MIINLKRKDLKKLVADGMYGGEMYYALDQAADKIRAIYVMFGRVDMLGGESRDTTDMVLDLVSNCAQYLIDNPKKNEYFCETAGTRVSIFADADGLIELDVHFNIL